MKLHKCEIPIVVSFENDSRFEGAALLVSENAFLVRFDKKDEPDIEECYTMRAIVSVTVMDRSKPDWSRIVHLTGGAFPQHNFGRMRIEMSRTEEWDYVKIKLITDDPLRGLS